MNDFASPRDIEASLKIHLMGQDVATPFVNVHQMPGKEAPIYVVTTESSLASLLQQFLEARTGRSCPYAQGFFCCMPARPSGCSASRARPTRFLASR